MSLTIHPNVKLRMEGAEGMKKALPRSGQGRFKMVFDESPYFFDEIQFQNKIKSYITA